MYSTPRLLAMSFNLLGFLCRVFRFDERLARVQHAQIISLTIVPCAALAGLRMVTGKLYNRTAAANIRGLDVKFKRFSLKFELGWTRKNTSPGSLRLRNRFEINQIAGVLFLQVDHQSPIHQLLPRVGCFLG